MADDGTDWSQVKQMVQDGIGWAGQHMDLATMPASYAALPDEERDEVVAATRDLYDTAVGLAARAHRLDNPDTP